MKNYLELSDIFQEESLEEKMMKLAKRIQKIRKEKGFTQFQLADRSFVSYGSIKRFERTGEISLSSFYKIAEALGLSEELDSLFENRPLSYEDFYHE